VSVVGGAVLVAGAVMMVTPGPGVAAIAAGLAILATEFAWAHRSLRWLRARASRAATTARESRHRRRLFFGGGLFVVLVVIAASVYLST
jgi:uncharacterized protein (TIGR02611 family)